MSEFHASWIGAPLGEISHVEMGQSPDSRYYNDLGEGLPFYQGKADFGALYPTVRKWCSQPTKVAQTGDILLSVRAPVGPTNLATEQCCVGRGLAAIRATALIEQKYLLYFFRHIQPWLSEQGTGTTFTAVSGGFLRNLEVGLAPINEQKRIADKLNAVLARVDACRERLDRVPAIMKRFRQSVLAAATSGKLTEDWRKNNPSEQEIVSATDKNPSLPEVPEGWRWVNLPQVGEMSRGKSRHRPRNEPSLYGGPYPFIQTGDIAQSDGRIIAHRQAYSEKGLAQSRLWPTGTVCITIAANIAESALLTYPASFPDSVVGIIPDPDVCRSEYVEFFIRVAKADLATFAPATAQKNINIAILNEVSVPLPTIPEQDEIVRRVEALFACADRLEARYTAARAQAERLTPALLAKAFRGELVPQDPNDEPAAVLLERIRAARTLRPDTTAKRSKAPRFPDKKHKEQAR